MALKSYRLMTKKKKNKPKRRTRARRNSLTGDVITGGIGALVGIGFLSVTADAVSAI